MNFRPIKKSFKKQWQEGWLVIILTAVLGLFSVYLSMKYQYDADIKYASPLFKYTYNTTDQSIEQDLGDDFSRVKTTWIIPTASTTATGMVKGSLYISDIVNAIIDNQTRQGNLLNWFDENLKGYVRCEILGSISVEGTSTLNTFPIGVKTDYVIKGSSNEFTQLKVKTNYDLILLRDFSSKSINVLSAPNVSQNTLNQFLYKNGSSELLRVMKIDPFENSLNYIDSDNNCNQFRYSQLEIPLIGNIK